ncbi:molybdopterin binding oxidoreductase [Cylindrobasidium torrendii FP15055 ss-10]|uniref:Molybdopterin binding oxidoreductase n=1 Tax=Cylindrobasidium torrendii FP15055 ss-10 TaxID=1314674 RepID=A0A0D7BFD2_9AGAR|nr:molybdopterin binding oxidoreductase [Cylindrobasidium torrendii FP15055 ss-10]
MDFSSEPPHSRLLRVQGREPFNAEPPSSSLVNHHITPVELVYNRNHGPVRILDEHSHSIQIQDEIHAKNMTISLPELKSLPRASVVAAHQCAGNRRNEMGKIKPVTGTGWDDGVVANCRWDGVRLRDVLVHVGVPYAEDLHVCFASHAAPCQDDKYYGASIPMKRAYALESDVLLAYEMNEEPIPSDHGGPLRVVVPGVVGARWVKWVDTLTISAHESPNAYQQRDYKVLPPNVDSIEAAGPVWARYPPLMTLPLNSVVATVDHDLQHGRLVVKGYATPSDEGNITVVDVSTDDGKTWVPARIVYQEGKWSWTLWEVELFDVQLHGVVLSRATDASGNVQNRECEWNFRGVAYNAWGRREW